MFGDETFDVGDFASRKAGDTKPATWLDPGLRQPLLKRQSNRRPSSAKAEILDIKVTGMVGELRYIDIVDEGGDLVHRSNCKAALTLRHARQGRSLTQWAGLAAFRFARLARRHGSSKTLMSESTATDATTPVSRTRS